MSSSWGDSWGDAWGDSWGSIAPVTLPIGAVPIRYVIGQINNVVPVETVLVDDFGVVPVRVFVGPDNVVPVRETNTEIPRVKIRKV